MSLLFAAGLLLAVGWLLMRRGRAYKRSAGVPDGTVIYQDRQDQALPVRPLVSLRHGISGTPDCLYRTSEGIVPVELKNSSRAPAGSDVYPNHRIQVLAYCVLAAEHYGESVPYGIVIYGKNEGRRVYPTEENIGWLMKVAGQVRLARLEGERSRSHSQRGRCRGCGLKQHCSETLTGAS